MNITSIPIIGFIAQKIFHIPNEEDEEILKTAHLQTPNGKTKDIFLHYEKRDDGKSYYIIPIPDAENSSIIISAFSREYECLEIKGEVLYAVVKEIADGQDVLPAGDPLRYQDVVIEFQLEGGKKFEIRTKYLAKETSSSELEIYDSNGKVMQSKINYIENVQTIAGNIFKNIKKLNLSVEDEQSSNTKKSTEEYAKETAKGIVDEAVKGISQDSKEFLSAKMIAVQKLTNDIRKSLGKERKEKIKAYKEKIVDKIEEGEIEKLFKETSEENIEIRAGLTAEKVVNEGVKKLNDLEAKEKKTDEFIQAKEKLIVMITQQLIETFG